MIELLLPGEMAEADRLTIQGGVSSFSLMERAALAVADAAATMVAGSGSNILVLAGPGNNGGDGLFAAALLRERGHNVRVILLAEPGRLRGDAAEAAGVWGGPFGRADEAIGAPELIVDALFGAGLNRPLEGASAQLIAAVNEARRPVLAVDLPSGVAGESGAVLGAAIRAQHTVTFFRRKPGHVLLPGRELCGRVAVADIGISASVLPSVGGQTFANAPPLWGARFPQPATTGHKYTRGHAVVVSGGATSTGAARLAARAALRAGAGVVTIAGPGEAVPVNAATNLAVMVRPIDGAEELGRFLDDPRINAVVLGPGGGVRRRMREQVRSALRCGKACVLDADALTSFAEDPRGLQASIARSSHAPVLTPHEGEFYRLFNEVEELSAVQGKLERGRRAAAWAGAVLVLKGPDTVVAAPDGRAEIAENAPAFLATAGSGDVLAGIIAGLLSQGMAPFEAASAGVWLHAEAAQAFGPGLIAEDLPEMLPPVVTRLFERLRGR